MKPTLDPTRTERTRIALLSTFRDLMFAQGYDRISVQAIAAGAGVARSTFYEHFAGREDILRASMAQFFTVIADCVSSKSRPEHLGFVLDHLWQNRRLADVVFSGTPRVILAQSLGEMVEARLRNMHEGLPLLLPYRLAAIQLAQAQLALVESWLRGRAYCKVVDMATALHHTSRASAQALARDEEQGELHAR